MEHRRFVPPHGDNLSRLQDEIALSATTEEEAILIAKKCIHYLNTTDWKELLHKKEQKQKRSDEAMLNKREEMLNKQSQCKRCKLRFKFRELQKANVSWDANLYCEKCLGYFKNHCTYTCPQCNIVYMSRKHNETCSKCLIKDKEKQKAVLQRHLRRAKNAQRPATLTLEQWLETLLYFDGNCAYCQSQPYEVLEHFIPISLGQEHGGGTTVDNCVPACDRCNKTKRSMLPMKIIMEDVTEEVMGRVLIKPYFISPINIETIERIWTYLDSKQPQNAPKSTLNEYKREFKESTSQWWEENKPKFRQRIFNIINSPK